MSRLFLHWELKKMTKGSLGRIFWVIFYGLDPMGFIAVSKNNFGFFSKHLKQTRDSLETVQKTIFEK